MTDTKIQRLRGIADAFDDASKSGEWELPKLFREAADELERFDKLRDAAMEVFISSVSGSAHLMAEKLIAMRNVMEAKE